MPTGSAFHRSLEPPLYRVAALDHPQPWELACAEGWEGVMAKRSDSTYQHRRSPDWLKMKCEIVEDLVVGGFTDPQGKRVGLGAFLLGLGRPPRPAVVAAGRTVEHMPQGGNTGSTIATSTAWPDV